MKKTLLFTVLFLFILAGCSTEKSYPTVSLKDAKQKIDQGAAVIDVRTPEEYAAGHIPNAILVPLQDIQADPKAALQKLDPKQEYIVICRSGNRSKAASEIMWSQGFKSIINTETGMKDWPYDTVTN
ncbi:rhodanese-like domain-containing protein [Ferviditalea candida]|uniref:Rhodanese-like domain-containing protein n=1 Tax=Ferviditalea candida TaxID=3108399 RepID=A0ABU5ZPX1_9BACL|nr:rhodanese-like domain-containing protein [Paenibacillaceae bacterium T2]